MSRRNTGFTTEVRDLIRDRAAGNCERCGDLNNVRDHGAQVHHRRPRGMGGTKRDSTNGPSNGLHLCGMCHRVVENNREISLNLGQLVRQQQDPKTVPVLYRGQWVLLDDDGYTYEIPAPVGGVAS
jgi:5-methylcytosine-specific restriction enzyme A